MTDERDVREAYAIGVLTDLLDRTTGTDDGSSS